MYKKYVKRIIDFFISFILLIMLSPLLIIVICWLHVANKGKGVFFKQERPGEKGKIFKIIKFKTMTDERDYNGKLLSDKKRLTKAGQFIRSTSIDELPQLINVLKGDMALIGPRPLLVIYLSLYPEYYLRRHDVRPGITGWAQVHGRNLLKLSKKFDYDVWYVKHVSLYLDIKILYLTIKNIFLKKDIGNGAENMKNVDDLHFMDKIKK
ncbi:MAG: sugar transferase [Bacteroidales bacterium]